MPGVRGVAVGAVALVMVVGGVALVVGAAGVAAAPSAHNTSISNYRFLPIAGPVFAGDTVTWTNLDLAPHTVTGVSGPAKLSSPPLHQGQTWSYTFALPGTYRYFCAVHPSMTATLVVVPAPVPAPSAGGVPVASTSTTGPKGAARSIPGPPALASEPGTVAPEAATTMAPSASASASVSASASGGGADVASGPPATFVTASAGGPEINPLLLLAAIAAAAAVFGVLVVGRRPRGDGDSR